MTNLFSLFKLKLEDINKVLDDPHAIGMHLMYKTGREWDHAIYIGIEHGKYMFIRNHSWRWKGGGKNIEKRELSKLLSIESPIIYKVVYKMINPESDLIARTRALEAFDMYETLRKNHGEEFEKLVEDHRKGIDTYAAERKWNSDSKCYNYANQFTSASFAFWCYTGHIVNITDDDILKYL